MNYNLFYKFIECYAPSAFKGIDPNDPLLMELEQMMEQYNQFFSVLDVIQMKIMYTSKRCSQMLGVDPEVVTPYHFFEVTHPDDIQRHSLGRTKMLKMAQDLYIAKKGESLLSTHLKIREFTGKYSCLLFQCYVFYCETPVSTVYNFEIHTDIDSFKKIKHGYHYYIGNDLTNFKYPDKELLAKGNIFTDRQFEIIKLVASGLSSEQIAKELFLSTFTVNTHRANILKKSGKAHLAELIYDLQQQGLL
jgi:hypothetical protein